MKNTKYIVIGDNDYVYGIFTNEKQKNKEIENIEKSLKLFGCGWHDEPTKPKTIKTFSITNKQEIDVSKIKKLK